MPGAGSAETWRLRGWPAGEAVSEALVGPANEAWTERDGEPDLRALCRRAIPMLGLPNVDSEAERLPALVDGLARHALLAPDVTTAHRQVQLLATPFTTSPDVTRRLTPAPNFLHSTAIPVLWTASGRYARLEPRVRKSPGRVKQLVTVPWDLVPFQQFRRRYLVNAFTSGQALARKSIKASEEAYKCQSH